MNNATKWFTLLITGLFLSSCIVPPMYNETICDSKKMDCKLLRNSPYEKKLRDAAICNQGLYVDPTPIPLEKNYPEWAKQTVCLHGNNLPLQFYLDRLTAGTKLLTIVNEDMNRNQRLSVNYCGDLKGALEYLAVQTNAAYQIQDNTIIWSSFLTKTFDVSFMPGNTSYMLGHDQASTSAANANNPSSNANTGIVGGTNLIITGSTSVGNQYSNITGKLSIWDDLAATIKSLLSKEGTATVSQSTTTITIHDHPSNVRAIQHYLILLNKELTRQVLVKVQVLEMTMNKGFDYGIDWNMIAGSLGVQGALSTPVPIPGFDSTNSPLLSWVLLPGAKSAQASGSAFVTQALINALNEQGRVSIVTQPSVVTLNNQVAEININTQTGYLAEVSTTITGTTGTTQTALTPGMVNTGFTMYVLPKIQGNKVYLQITSHLSDPPVFSTKTSGGQSIQVPTVDEKRFNQRSLVPSEATLVLAGYRQVQRQAGKNSFFGTGLMGGVGAKAVNSEIIILVTPVIMGPSEVQ